MRVKKFFAAVLVSAVALTLLSGCGGSGAKSGGGDAKVIPLENNNTTLLEVLASAGGVNRRGNARKVKLFRWDVATGKRQVYEFDLSDISGLRFADIVMQGEVVVYVHPNPDLAREALQDLTPVITLLTSVLLVIGIVQGFQ